VKRLIFLTLFIVSAAQLHAGSGVWHKTVAAAQKEARSKNQLIFVDMFADWCGWCRRMDREVFPAEAFQKATADMVLLRLDTEDGGEGQAFARDMGVNSLPTFLLLTPDLGVAAIMQGYLPAPKFAEQLTAQRAGYETFRKDLANEARLDHARRLELGKQLIMRRSYKDAEQRLTRLNADRKLGSELKADVVYHLAVAQYHQKKFPSSLQLLEQVSGIRSESSIQEQSRFLRAQILLEQGKQPEALGQLREFRSRHPQSQLLMHVNRLILQLETSGVKAP
jgi:thioredoxin-related protein